MHKCWYSWAVAAVFGEDPICISVSFSFGISVCIGVACLKQYVPWAYLVVGWGEGVVYLVGIQLILAYCWARPAVLAACKVEGECYFFCFFTFIPVPLSYLSPSFISFTISFLNIDSFSSFSPVLHFHLLYYIFYNFTKRKIVIFHRTITQ